MSFTEFEVVASDFSKSLAKINGLIECTDLPPDKLFCKIPWRIGSVSECIHNLLETFPYLRISNDGSYSLPSCEKSYIATEIDSRKIIGIINIFSPLNSLISGIYIDSNGQQAGFICIEEDNANEDDFINWSLKLGENN